MLIGRFKKRLNTQILDSQLSSAKLEIPPLVVSHHHGWARGGNLLRLYFLTPLRLWYMGRKLPISPGAQMGWEFTYRLRNEVFLFELLYLDVGETSPLSPLSVVLVNEINRNPASDSHKQWAYGANSSPPDSINNVRTFRFIMSQTALSLFGILIKSN